MTAGQRCAIHPDPAQRVFVLAVCLLCTAMVFDLFDFTTRTGALGLPAFWMASVGLVLGALALAFALREVPLPIPWRELPGSAWALLVRPLSITLFGASLALRRPEADIPLTSLVLSVLGAALAVVAGLGGAGLRAPGGAPAERQPPRDSELTPPGSQSGLGEDSLPPEADRARAL